MTEEAAQSGQSPEPASRGRIDPDLARGFAMGEEEAFERVVAACQQGLRRLVYRLLGWEGDVEDVVQDVFVVALRRRRQFQGRSDLFTWLAAIAVNRCRSYQRRQFLRRALWRRAGGAAGPPRPPGAAAGAMDRETAQRVQQALRRLPGRYREVAVLRYVEEMDPREIAAALGVRPGTVLVRLHRARQMLKKQLSDLVEDEQ
jgi:RNA polymerase sigma-70 factor (ECF subfamily)